MSLGPFAILKSKPAPSIKPLVRLATTGIYLLRGIPRDLQRAARIRAEIQGTTVHSVLLEALREYADGSWAPGRKQGKPS